jgi:acyl carrier protein
VLTRADRPTAEKVLGVVRDALTMVLEIDPGRVSADSVLAELDVDSLALVEVAEIVEEKLAPYASAPFVIPDSDLESLATVGQTVDYVLARLS